MPLIANIAAYKFAPLANLKPLRERLLLLCKGWGLKGTILLSPEGINLFVAGHRTELGLLLDELRAVEGLADLSPKFSESDERPFSRMLVRIKTEIIAFGVEGINPALRTSPKLRARELKQWLDEGRPVTLLDTRNDYEVKLGTFKNALPIGVDNFRQFPDAVRRLPAEMKEAPIVMFCTGGIRCEKAGPFMEREGFLNIFQLDGGILKYFEECGGEHYDGECFVFDHRVGVDPGLQETGTSLCFCCQMTLTEEEQLDPRYVPSESCPYCYKTGSEQIAHNVAQRQEALQRAVTPLPGSRASESFRPILVPAEHEGATVLELLCGIFGEETRPDWENLCGQGVVLDSEHKGVSSIHRVKAGERYLRVAAEAIEPDVNPDIRILHEDESVLVVSKPAPLPMQFGGLYRRNTLESILNTVYSPRKTRPVHCLDADVTGVALLARTRHFGKLLKTQFVDGNVEIVYLVRVQGHPKMDSFATGSPKIEFQVVHRAGEGTSLLHASSTGDCSSQIREQLAFLGLPVCGDSRIAGDLETPICLHSWKIGFTHPISGERVEFECAPPAWATPS